MKRANETLKRRVSLERGVTTPFVRDHDEDAACMPSLHVWVLVRIALRSVWMSSAWCTDRVWEVLLTIWNEVIRLSMLHCARNLQSWRARNAVMVRLLESRRCLSIRVRYFWAADRDLRTENRP